MLNGAIKVLLVDDHALVRAALAERLSREAGIRVVASAATADEAIERARECQPDIVVMDIDMPGTLCFDAVRTIGSFLPRAQVVFLSGFVSDGYVEQALSVHARGYVVKREAPEVVVKAIREAATGGAYFSEEVRQRIVVTSGSVSLAAPTRCRLATVTPREGEVLAYIARGLTKKEIGHTMHISVKTVDHHAARLMRKLDIHDRVELARFAIREGLVQA